MRVFLPLLTALFTGPAWASYPDDVSLSSMDAWRGESINNPGATRKAYETVVRQLAAGIMNAPTAPSETLGLSGFDVSLTSTWAFISARGEDESHPAPWERVHVNEDPTHVMWRPGISFRKGLPLSLEVGANWSWVGFSRQTAIGGFGRWSIIEGWDKAPDVSMQLGYTGYVGNEELELGALDGSLSFGYTVPFGYIVGVNQAAVSPYGGVGFLKANAAPRVDADTQDALGIGAVSGMKSKDSFKKGFTQLTTHLGVQIRSGDFTLKAAGSIVPDALPTISMGIGLTY